MSAHEIGTRLRQAYAARADALAYRLGRAPAQPSLTVPPTAMGRFFFEPAEALPLAQHWHQSHAPEASATVERAEQILTRRYPLLGYAAVDFGDPPDFQLDPVNRRRSPLAPFASVPYLDFDAVGDHKVTWELSRHQHLVTLARAYLFTGDRRFADEAVVQFRHWCVSNPYPLGINWTSTLEVAFRILSWMWMDHLLAGTLASDAALRRELAAHIGHGAWFIERYLSTYFSQNTHLMGEAYALFAAGIVYRQLRDSSRWAAEGWRVVNEEAQKQVPADGFHFEQSTYYHVYSLDFFLHARMLGQGNGLDTGNLDAVLPRMAEGLAAISQAGLAPRFGDDDGGRLFDPARNRTQDLIDPLATAAVLYGNPAWKALAHTPREETMWLMGAGGLAQFDQIPVVQPRAKSICFPQSGYVCLAQEAGLLVADAGPQGWGAAGHGHADALSVQLIAAGQALLTDPGTGTYPFDTPERNQLRQTSAHSTLEIDRQGQAEPAGSFRWESIPAVTIEHFHAGGQASVLSARHDGYLRLADPVTHRRVIVSIDGAGWLVHDGAQGLAKHDFRIRWQLPPEAKAIQGESGWEVQYPSGQVLQICSEAGGESAWRWQQQPSLWSPRYGAIERSNQLIFQAGEVRIADVATLLSVRAPGATATDAEVVPQLKRIAQETGCTVFEWTSGQGKHRIWISPASTAWRAARVESDAALVVASADSDGALRYVYAAAVGYLFVGGECVVGETGQRRSYEWPAGERAPENWNPAPLAKLFVD